jgi:hypothetical protein
LLRDLEVLDSKSAERAQCKCNSVASVPIRESFWATGSPQNVRREDTPGVQLLELIWIAKMEVSVQRKTRHEFQKVKEIDPALVFVLKQQALATAGLRTRI